MLICKRKILFFVVVVLSSICAEADYRNPDLEKLLSLFQNINEPTKFSELTFEILIEKYQEKCRRVPAKDGCFLLETDILPSNTARKNRTLLFRGESRLYPLPAVSALVRNEIGAKNFCDANCGSARLLQSLQISLEKLPHKLIIVNDSTNSSAQALGEHVLSEDLSDWTGSGMSVPASQRRSILTILATNHLQSYVSLYKKRGATLFSIDPLVSFSKNPLTAIAYANRKRLIIASVPTENMTVVSSSQCQNAGIDTMRIYNLSACSLIGWWVDEEWDMFLHLPSEYLFHVITK